MKEDHEVEAVPDSADCPEDRRFLEGLETMELAEGIPPPSVPSLEKEAGLETVAKETAEGILEDQKRLKIALEAVKAAKDSVDDARDNLDWQDDTGRVAARELRQLCETAMQRRQEVERANIIASRAEAKSERLKETVKAHALDRATAAAVYNNSLIAFRNASVALCNVQTDMVNISLERVTKYAEGLHKQMSERYSDEPTRPPSDRGDDAIITDPAATVDDALVYFVASLNKAVAATQAKVDSETRDKYLYSLRERGRQFAFTYDLRRSPNN